MGVRGDDILVGGLCLLMALFNAWRILSALQKGEVPLYRKRLRRAETAQGKFVAAVAVNVALVGVLLVIGADLLLGLGLRGR